MSDQNTSTSTGQVAVRAAAIHPNPTPTLAERRAIAEARLQEVASISAQKIAEETATFVVESFRIDDLIQEQDGNSISPFLFDMKGPGGTSRRVIAKEVQFDIVESAAKLTANVNNRGDQATLGTRINRVQAIFFCVPVNMDAEDEENFGKFDLTNEAEQIRVNVLFGQTSQSANPNLAGPMAIVSSQRGPFVDKTSDPTKATRGRQLVSEIERNEFLNQITSLNNFLANVFAGYEATPENKGHNEMIARFRAAMSPLEPRVNQSSAGVGAVAGKPNAAPAVPDDAAITALAGSSATSTNDLD
jgi:hypothetical protein